MWATVTFWLQIHHAGGSEPYDWKRVKEKALEYIQRFDPEPLMLDAAEFEVNFGDGGHKPTGATITVRFRV